MPPEPNQKRKQPKPGHTVARRMTGKDFRASIYNDGSATLISKSGWDVVYMSRSEVRRFIEKWNKS